MTKINLLQKSLNNTFNLVFIQYLQYLAVNFNFILHQKILVSETLLQGVRFIRKVSLIIKVFILIIILTGLLMDGSISIASGNSSEDPESSVCELSIAKTVVPQTVTPGDQINYSIYLKNIGTGNCTGGGVELQEFYDPLTSFVSSDPEPSIDNDNWNFGTLFPGDEETIEILVNVSESSQGRDIITNKACVWAYQFGPKDNEESWQCVEAPVIVVEDPCKENHAPAPVIEPQDLTIEIGEAANFNANNSTDEDSDDLEFTWTVPELNIEQTGATLSFTPDELGAYTINLQTQDQCEATTASVSLIIESKPEEPKKPEPPPPANCPGCGFIYNPPAPPPPPSLSSKPKPVPESEPEPKPVPEKIVLATTTVEVFTAPAVSPRAGSGLPIKEIAVGLFSGLISYFISIRSFYLNNQTSRNKHQISSDNQETNIKIFKLDY